MQRGRTALVLVGLITVGAILLLHPHLYHLSFAMLIDVRKPLLNQVVYTLKPPSNELSVNKGTELYRTAQSTTEPVSKFHKHAESITKPVSEMHKHAQITSEPLNEIQKHEQRTAEPMNEIHKSTSEPVNAIHTSTLEPVNEIHKSTSEPVNAIHTSTLEPVNEIHKHAHSATEPVSQIHKDALNTSEPVSEIHKHAQNSTEPVSKTTAGREDNATSLKELKRKLQILPIRCFPDSEGLFPKKYDKLLLSLAEYTNFHGKTSDVRHLIWKCEPNDNCGGLLDRIRGITYALLLAVFSRRRLLLYWGMYFPEQAYLKPNLINWVPQKSDIEGMTSYPVTNWYLSGNEYVPKAMNAIGSNVEKVAINTNFELEALTRQNFRPQWLTDGMKRTGLAGLSDEEINDVFGIAFRYLFHFRDDVIQKVQTAKHSLGLDMQKYVAVHVRTGFMGSNPEYPHAKLVRKQEQWEQMLTCAVNVADSKIGSNSSIFLASDSRLVHELATKMYGERIKIYKAESEAVWVDFFLLAESYIQVRSGADWIKRSGFAVGASRICRLPRSRTIDALNKCTSDSGDKL